MKNNYRNDEESDKEDLNLVIEISSQINLEKVEFSTAKSKRRIVMTWAASKKP